MHRLVLALRPLQHHRRPFSLTSCSVRRCCKNASRASLVPQMVKHPSAVLETQVQSLGREDPLEKEVATHSSTLAWKLPWTEEPGRLQSMGSQRVRHD